MCYQVNMEEPCFRCSDSLLWDTQNHVDLNARFAHLDKKYLERLDGILAQQVELIKLAEGIGE